MWAAVLEWTMAEKEWDADAVVEMKGKAAGIGRGYRRRQSLQRLWELRWAQR